MGSTKTILPNRNRNLLLLSFEWRWKFLAVLRKGLRDGGFMQDMRIEYVWKYSFVCTFLNGYFKCSLIWKLCRIYLIHFIISQSLKLLYSSLRATVKLLVSNGNFKLLFFTIIPQIHNAMSGRRLCFTLNLVHVV